jgi:hypothetical protein
MADSGGNDKSEWEKLCWKEKVQICQQGISGEDSLLISYVVIFVALEATFAALVISQVLCSGSSQAIAVLGIALAVIFILVCKRRGDIVDRWGAILYKLWKEVPGDEMLDKSSNLPKGVGEEEEALVKAEKIVKDYGGCRRRLQGGWKAILCGWSPCHEKRKLFFKSARRLTIVFCPVLVIVMWALVLCQIVAQ